MRFISAVRFILTALLVCNVYLSCDLFNACDQLEHLVANAGPDQTTIVGSYVIFDASESIGDIDRFEWEQDINNPAEVQIYSGDNLIHNIGFIKEGIYKFRLTVRQGVTPANPDGTAVSEPDEIIITVNPNPQQVFDDLHLEIAVRFKLRKQTETLTENVLLTLISLDPNSISMGDYIASLGGIERCMNLENLSMGVQRIEDLTPLTNLIKS